MASTPSKDSPSPAQPSTGTSANPLAENSTGTDGKQPLPLPEPPKDGETINLTVGGDGVKLDHMGPLVVNQDGTMSRISNWAEMSEIERQNTLRILGKRNQQRLKKLREDAGLSPDGN
ncbi:hypothetical protein TruAng_011262 [Truncatella angustata]|nr:hypothetical protein TruAng_011262 [Truncatella angustata]